MTGPAEYYMLGFTKDQWETFGAIATILAVAVPAVWWAAKRVHKNLMMHKTLHEELLKIAKQVNNELQPNGGASLRDAVDRIELRQALQEQIQEGMGNALLLPFWFSNTEGQCTLASIQLCRTLGVTENEILGNNWVALTHPDDRGSVKESWDYAVVERRNFQQVYRFIKPDGTVIKVRGNATPLLNPKDGSVMRYFGTITVVE